MPAPPLAITNVRRVQRAIGAVTPKTRAIEAQAAGGNPAAGRHEVGPPPSRTQDQGALPAQDLGPDRLLDPTQGTNSPVTSRATVDHPLTSP